jgi:hypothetical protein
MLSFLGGSAVLLLALISDLQPVRALLAGAVFRTQSMTTATVTAA